MKKLLLIALCAVFCIALCSCGEEKKEENTATTAPATTQAASSAATKATEAQTTNAQSVESSEDGTSPYASAKEAAVAEAKKYLENAACSYEGLISQLEYMGYAPEDAKYGADNCGADWYEQAKKRAYTLGQTTEYNYDNFVEQLENEGFSRKEAEAGAQYAGEIFGGSSKRDEALETALGFVNSGSSYSYATLIDMLEAEGYSQEDAQYAANNCGADWNQQAVNAAEKYVQSGINTKEDLIDKLMANGFSYEQAVYGAETIGF